MDSQITRSLYRAIDVWKKVDNKKVIRFRCFEIVDEGMFCVQSADYFHYPLDSEQLIASEYQFIELFMECLPDERASKYSSLIEAISAHEKEFDDF